MITPRMELKPNNPKEAGRNHLIIATDIFGMTPASREIAESLGKCVSSVQIVDPYGGAEKTFDNEPAACGVYGNPLSARFHEPVVGQFRREGIPTLPGLAGNNSGRGLLNPAPSNRRLHYALR